MKNYTKLTKDLEKKEINFISKEGISFLSIDDAGYPEDLRNIYGSPKCLFVKGDKINSLNPRVAIVGSRRCSAYGMQTAETLAFELALNGYTIVSGMAKGIDQAAHRGALKAGGKTIAVMGTGFNNLYPTGSIKMYDEISKNGAVITEFPSFVEPLAYNFPQRNRIISGLSLGVVVVEAAARSGSLITSRLALEQGKEVFAVPGRIDNRYSDGTNKLINDGARIVTKVEDIVADLKEIISARNIKTKHYDLFSEKETEYEDLTEQENDIRLLFKNKQVLSFEDVVSEIDVAASKLSEVLLKMEMKKILKSLPGKNYQLKQR